MENFEAASMSSRRMSLQESSLNLPRGAPQSRPAPSRTSESAVSSLSTLPTELKLEILGHLLIIGGPISEWTHGIHSTVILLRLLLINKEFSILATQVYYEKNLFTMSSYSGSLKFPHPKFTKWIRRLEVHLCVTAHEASIDDLLMQADWKYLLDTTPSTATPDRAKCLRWQSHFPRLEFLKIVLYQPHAGGDAGPLQPLRGRARVYINAKKVHVEMRLLRTRCLPTYSDRLWQRVPGLIEELFDKRQAEETD